MNTNFENAVGVYSTINGAHKKVSKVLETVNGLWKTIYESSQYRTIIYNANGGVFASGTTTNNVLYDIKTETTEITKISKTSNVSEDGSSFSGSYGDNKDITDIVTIPGAESLEVAITYATENTKYDWVCIYDSSITPTVNNYSSSISGKLGGATKTTKTYTVQGDTVKIFLRSDSSSSNYYGYYATIKGVGQTTTAYVYEGDYIIPSYNDDTSMIFEGWYTDKDCTQENKFNHDIDISSLKTNITLYAKYVPAILIDFEFIDNGNGTYTLIDWKETLNGEPSTRMIIPNDSRIKLV